MKFLLDTHLLVWATAASDRLSQTQRDAIDVSQNELHFSVASLWEIAIKSAQGRADFTIEPGRFRRQLLEHGYAELPVLGAHAVAVAALPPIHKDPFDRLMIAQAQVENIVLLTADADIARYPGPIRRI